MRRKVISQFGLVQPLLVQAKTNFGDVGLTSPFDIGLHGSITYHATTWTASSGLPTTLKDHTHLNPLSRVEALIPVIEYIDIALLQGVLNDKLSSSNLFPGLAGFAEIRLQYGC